MSRVEVLVAVRCWIVRGENRLIGYDLGFRLELGLRLGFRVIVASLRLCSYIARSVCIGVNHPNPRAPINPMGDK